MRTKIFSAIVFTGLLGIFCKAMALDKASNHTSLPPSVCGGAAPQVATPTHDTYVGLHHPPLPSGIEDLGSFVVESKNGIDTELGISFVRDSKGVVIFLDQIFYQEGCPNPESVVLDYRRVPRLNKNEALQHNCRLGDVSNGGDGITIAVTMNQHSEILRKARLAWRIDAKSRKLVEIRPQNIQCINEAFLERD